MTGMAIRMCSRGSVQPASDQEIAAFAYLLDFQNDNGPANSNATYGVSYSGVFDRFTVDATFARQSDWADNPLAYDAVHYAVQSALQLDPVTLTVAYEVLGSDDGRTAFRTPVGYPAQVSGLDRQIPYPARGWRQGRVVQRDGSRGRRHDHRGLTMTSAPPRVVRATGPK